MLGSWSSNISFDTTLTINHFRHILIRTKLKEIKLSLTPSRINLSKIPSPTLHVRDSLLPRNYTLMTGRMCRRIIGEVYYGCRHLKERYDEVRPLGCEHFAQTRVLCTRPPGLKTNRLETTRFAFSCPPCAQAEAERAKATASGQ